MSVQSDIDFNINEALKKVDILTAEVRRGFADQAKSVEKETGKMERRFKDAFRRMASRATAFLSTISFGVLLRQTVKVNGDLEQMRVAFDTMLGSAEAGGKAVKEIFEFTETTPFEFGEVAQAGRVLLAMGGSAQTLQQELKLVGDIASGTGQSIVEIASIFGKIRAKQRLTAEEMMQLAERGIPIYEELEKVTGQSGEALNKLVETGKIRFPVLEQVFRNLTTEGGKFNNMMEVQSKTALGLLSTLKDFALQGFRDITGGLFDTLKQDLEGVKAAVESARDTGRLAQITTAIGNTLTTVYNAIKAVTGFIVEHRKEIGFLIRAYISYQIAIKLVTGLQYAWRGAMVAGTAVMTAYNAVLKLITGGYATYRWYAVAATAATKAFRTALATTGIGALTVALAIAIERFYQYSTAASEGEKATDAYRESLINARAELAGLSEEQMKNAEQQARMAQLQAVMQTQALYERRRELEAIVGTTGIKTPTTAAEAMNPVFGGATAKEQVDARRELNALNDQIDAHIRNVAELTGAWQAAKDAMKQYGGPTSGGGGGDDFTFDGDEKAVKMKAPTDPVRSIIAETLATASKDFETEINRLQVDLAKGLINDEQFEARAREVAEKFRDRFLFMLEAGQSGIFGGANIAEMLGRDLTDQELAMMREMWLKAFGDVQGVLDDTKEKTDDGTKGIKNMVAALRSVRTAVNGMRQLGRELGLISDELSNVIDGALNAADAMGSILEARADIKTGSLTGSAATTALVSGYVGVATSVASTLVGLFGRNQDSVEKAVKENTRRIEKAVREANEEPRPGSDLSSDLRNKIASELLLANAQLSGTLQSGVAGSEYTRPIMDQFKDLFKTLTDSGDFDESVLKSLQDNLNRALTTVVDVRYENDGSITNLLDKSAIAKAQQDIIDFLDPILGGGGSFNRGTVGGALQEAQFLQQFGGVGNEAVFQLMLDNLIALVDEGNDTNDLLTQLRGLDPVADAELIRTIMEEYARRIADPSDIVDLGALSPSDFDDIFNAIAGLLDGGTGSDPGQSLSASVSRSITEVQAGLLTDLTRDVAYWTERGALAAEALLSMNRGHTAVQGQGSSALSVQNTFNGITPETRRAAHRALDDAMEEAVRLRERRLF